MALNIGNVDPLFIREQPHINKQAAEHDGQRLNRSGHAGPAAVFSFSQQALDSAKDAGRSQPALERQATAAAVAARGAVEQAAPVETAAAVVATGETAKAHAAKPDAPRRKDHTAADAGSTEETWGTDEAASTGESASAAEADRRVSYQDLLDRVPR